MGEHGIRLPLVEPGTRPELAALESRILGERGRISLLYRALLNSAPIASGWERMLTAVRNESSLSADLRELMILRIAVLNKAEFEFEAHVPHALKAGVSQGKIDATRKPVLADDFSALEAIVLQATDSLTKDVALPDSIYQQLEQHFTSKELVELIATIAAYNMVSRFLVAFRIGH